MSWRPIICLVILLGSVMPLAPVASAQNTGPLSVKDIKPESFKRWGDAEILLVGKLNQVVAGPVGLSEPPLRTHKLNFTIEEVLRGELKAGPQIAAQHVVRQNKVPVFPEGKKCVVALANVQGGWRVTAVAEATEAELKQARLASLVPMGWTFKDGELFSPWAALGKKAWPADDKGTGWLCATTGRPALTCGQGVRLTVEPVPPAVKLQFKNPDGDGEYRVTLTNTTDKAVTVPALLSDGKNILWNDCLVILSQKKTYTAPGAAGVQEMVKPVTLKPGESVSTVVNVLKLQGPDWPRGGYRIEFQFCLGEKSATQSMYYYSAHHDPLRAKAQEK